MEPELKTLLVALVDGQVKLADGQVKLADELAKTNAAVAKTNAAVAKLAGEVRKLAQAQRGTERRLTWLAEQVIRGFTNVNKRPTRTDR